MSRGYKARVRCEFCSFRREPVLQYNPLNELHRLRIELEANGKLSFVIDTDVTSCFRLGFVRLGSDRWDPLGKSLVTNNDEWMHISRVILKGAHASLAVRVAAMGLGDVRVLKNGKQAVLMSFRPVVPRYQPLSRASYIPGPLVRDDVLDVEIRYAGLANG